MKRFFTLFFVTSLACWPVLPQCFRSSPPRLTKPVLLVWESDDCDACKAFRADWPLLKSRLQSRFDVRKHDFDNDLIQRAQQQVTAVPSFVVFDGRSFRTAYRGYSQAERNRFLRALGLPPIRPPTPKTGAVPRPPKPRVDRPTPKAESPPAFPAVPIPDLLDRLKPNSESSAVDRGFTERSGGGWFGSILKTCGSIGLKLGLTAAAGKLAIPAAGGAGALWLGSTLLGIWRKRRERKRFQRHGVSPATPPANHTTETIIERPAPDRTVNHYITKPTDRLGEAFREALRRVGAVYRDSAPQTIEVIKQIEHVADEIYRGENVATRDQRTTRPGIFWKDES